MHCARSRKWPFAVGLIVLLQHAPSWAADSSVRAFEAERAVGRFVGLVNSGLYRAAAACLETVPATGDEQPLGQAFERFFSGRMDAIVSGTTIILAKRLCVSRDDGTFEIRCVVLWRVQRRNRPLLRARYNERFRVRIGARGEASIVGADVLPVFVHYGGRPKKLRQHLREAEEALR